MWTYLNGAFFSHEQVTISPFDRGFLFSDGVYDVIRYYPTCGFFQAEAHLRRLLYGIDQLRIQKVDTTQITQVIEDLLQKNGQTKAEAIAYIQVTRGSYYPRQHFFPPPSTQPTVFISTSPFKPHTEEIEKGVRVLLEDDLRWSRCDIKTIALIPNVLSRQNAVDAAAGETIWARDGFITEGTHTNFCAVKSNTVITPPRSNHILSGITRQVVLDLCQRLAIPFREVQIGRNELPSLDECMIVGTTTEITPVVKINEWKIGSGLPGAVTRTLQRELYKIMKKEFKL
jgi:D-alanine transaminase